MGVPTTGGTLKYTARYRSADKVNVYLYKYIYIYA